MISRIFAIILLVVCTVILGVEPVVDAKTPHDEIAARVEAPKTPKLKYPNLRHCRFLKRNETLSTIKERWDWDISGEDLFRNHAAVKNANYGKSHLAIVDSGLDIKDPKSAGEQLTRVSLGKDVIGHGTATAGVSVSKKFGVNPHLPIVPISVFSEKRESLEAREALIANGIIEAADNPNVSVINLSVIAPNSQPMIEAVKYAIEKGKWVSYAAGNDNEEFNSDTALLAEFAEKDELFALGALSYYGAPTSFSIFGKSIVDFYAPGIHVPTLDAYYDPKEKGSKSWRYTSGTSFAAPKAGAVIATLRAIYPKLTAEEADTLLAYTAIKRGNKHVVFQLNPYHAVELLTQTMRMMGTKCNDLVQCFPLAEKKIETRVEALLKKAKLPKTNNCGQWQRYVNRHRMAYFLSEGPQPPRDNLASQKLLDFYQGIGSPYWAENVYFAKGRETLEKHAAAQRTVRRLAKDEYYSGRRFFERGLTERRQTTAEPTMKSLDQILSECDSLFYRNPKEPKLSDEEQRNRERAHNECRGILGAAPDSVVEELAKKLVEKNKPIKATALYSFHDIDEKNKQKLISLAVQDWEQDHSFEQFDDLGYRLDWMDKDTEIQYRDKLLKLLKDPKYATEDKKLKEQKEEILSQLYSLFIDEPNDVIKEHEAMFIAYRTEVMKANDAYPWKGYGKHSYLMDRYHKGFGDKKTIMESLNDYLKTTKRNRDNQDSSVADDVIRLLNNPKYTADIYKWISNDHARNGFAWKALLESFNTSYVLTALEKAAPHLVEDWAKKVVEHQDKYFEYIGSFLSGHKDNPHIAALIEKAVDPSIEIKAPGLLDYRKRYFKTEMLLATEMTDEIQTYIQENPEAVRNPLSLSPGLIMDDAGLFDNFVNWLSSKDSGNNIMLNFWINSYFNSFSDGGKNSDAMKRILKEAILPNIDKLWQSRDRDWGCIPCGAATLENYVLAVLEDSSSEEIRDIMKMARKAFSEPTKDPERYEPKKNQLAEFVFRLGNTKGGKKLLAKHPEHATWIAAEAIKSSDKILSTRVRILESVKDELRKNLPTPESLGDPPELPPWVFALISDDLKAAQMAVKYINIKEDDWEFDDKVSKALTVFLNRNLALSEDVAVPLEEAVNESEVVTF